ncbi:MAG: 2-oxoacid:acceptor oxidoreductase family protein [Theionarchaea archaeon]|nr:2-oxoacid:acceptor oxidoreductase family protein [Theionarchaea archaeon]MBU7036918.1 2-oxoacid:acceptor oxidoreductase family protein [Theionarchaea archaeon]
MIEIRFHGRGGQGAVIASEILADAAFRDGKYVQAFPMFGVERRGAPVTAFTRIDNKPIRIKFFIYNPDYVVVLDPTLVGQVDVAAGCGMSSSYKEQEEGKAMILINTSMDPKDVGLKGMFSVATVDATSIAVKYKLGSRQAPIVNTAILGAFAKATGEISLDLLLKAIGEGVPAKQEENAQAAKEAYEMVVL